MSWIIRSKAVRDAVLRGEEPDWLRKHPRRDYVRQRILATPPWITVAQIEAVYAQRGPGETAKGNKWNPHQLNFMFFSGQVDFLNDSLRGRRFTALA
jgi:hypothetical protein